MGRRRLPTVGDDTSKGIGLVAFCGGCRRHRYYSPEEANRAFGPNTPIKAAEVRLRCQECGTTGRTRPGVQLSMSMNDFYARLPNVGRPLRRDVSTDPDEPIEF